MGRWSPLSDVYGAPLFAYYAANPEVEASAAARMLARSLPAAREFAVSDAVRGARTVVDVGGGKGRWPIAARRCSTAIMLAYAGGRERTAAEFTQLLEHAGLRLASTHPLDAGPHLIEAVAV